MSLREFIARNWHCRQFNRFPLPALALAAAVAGCAQPAGTVQPLPEAGTAPAQPVVTAPPATTAPAPVPDGARPLPPPVPRPASKPALPSSKHFVRGTWQQLPGWRTDTVEAIWRPFLANCRSIILRTGRPVSNTAPPMADPYAWQQACAAARDLPPTPSADQVRAFMEQWLQPWTVRGPGSEVAAGLATSYYEPLVHASRERGGAYQWPLYAVPPTC